MIVRSGALLKGTAAAAAIVGVVVVVATAVPAAAAAAPPPTPAPAPPTGQWAPAGRAAIHPGVVTETAGGGACTSNFVFTAAGRTFIGQAAHCAGTGADTETDGCTARTAPLGTQVDIRSDDGTYRRGTLAYSSWVTMQAKRETDPAACAYNDFALVELDPRDVAGVNPSVPFFGGPTGVHSGGLPTGQQVFSYGGSPTRDGLRQLDPKAGVSNGDVGRGFGHLVVTVSPGIPGDSGSAFLDSAGLALGVLSTLNLAPVPTSNGVSDVAKALAYADANGGLGAITLVGGTEPFTSAPAGIPAKALPIPAIP